MSRSCKDIKALQQHSKHMRLLALNMAYNCGGSAHLGGGLSTIDALSVLYGYTMNTAEQNLAYEDQDKFILSKGHGVLGLYAALAEYGIIPVKILDTFLCNESDLIAHPVMKPEIGLESSSGSLGQGISMAVGLALAAKKRNYSYMTYVLCGNGECNEGSVWEACMSAVNYRLDNFTFLLDNNRMQSDGESRNIMDVSGKYADLLKTLGFNTFDIDGHNIDAISNALDAEMIEGKPKAIVLNTIKGKGVSFMENNAEWHHNRLTKAQYDAALAELEYEV